MIGLETADKAGLSRRETLITAAAPDPATAQSESEVAAENRCAVFEASMLYAVGDLHQLARQAPPAKAEVIHAVAGLLATLASAKI